MKSKFAFVIAMLITASFATTAKAEGKLDTPKNTLKTMIKSLTAGKVDAAIECFDVEEANKPLVKAQLSIQSAFMKFDSKMRAAYKDKYDADKLGQFKGAILSEKMVDDAEVSEDGDTATVTIGGKPLELKKVDGKWKIQAAIPELPEAQVKMQIEVAELFKKAVNDATALIGKEGQTVETVTKALEENMKKAFQEMMKKAMEQMQQGNKDEAA